VLAIAGGQNVVGGDFNTYPTLDSEQIIGLNPDVVINLMPAATKQELEKNQQFWTQLPEVSAVRTGRVHQLTEPHLLLHASNLGHVAELMAERLHPDAAASQPVTAATAGSGPDKDEP
jgi:ABC-type Fe3+-hydroxamate transport system substrate-binding protein